MTPALHRVGTGAHRVVTVDGIMGGVDAVVDLAAAMAPFPPAGNFYPGVRRVFAADDTAATAYVDALLTAAAPFIAGGFDVDAFDLVEASFSIVTADPAALAPLQRVPHFDATDEGHLAVMHYLSGVEGSGTAFFRHRATGIEMVTPQLYHPFLGAVRAERDAEYRYIAGSTDTFEEIGRVEARPDRLVAYQGRLLHSGIIPPDMPLDPDPRRGRLTANLFLQLKR